MYDVERVFGSQKRRPAVYGSASATESKNKMQCHATLEVVFRSCLLVGPGEV